MIRITEKSLVEQMGLSDREIARRLHLLDFTNDDLDRVREIAPHIDASLDAIIQDFYRTQLEDSEIAAVIGDIDTLKRLQGHMKGYIRLLFKGDYTSEYANNRLRIGKVHKRMAVTPKLYMSGIATLQGILDAVIADSADADATRPIQNAVHKMLLFDSQLVFEAYIDGFLKEMETAREEVDKYASDLGVKVDTFTRHMHEIATKDALTGLCNRRALHEYLDRECGVARRHGLPLTLLYMDLNGFKPVNDAHGHDAGDQVLRHVGETLSAITRAVDIPARYGGDEFCIVMPRTTLKGADIPLQRLMEDFDRRVQYPVTFSIGVVQTGPEDVLDPSELIRQADAKMYAAKARAKKDGAHHVER